MKTPSIPAPEPLPPPPPPPEAEKAADPAVAQARNDVRKRAKQAAGQNGTILTGAQGDLSAVNSGGKSLLGG